MGRGAGDDVDRGAVSPAVVRAVGSEQVDLADLERAGALLRYRVARDGVLLAGEPAEFLAFRQEAVRYWCDAGPVIRAALDDVLAGLDRPPGAA